MVPFQHAVSPRGTVMPASPSVSAWDETAEGTALPVASMPETPGDRRGPAHAEGMWDQHERSGLFRWRGRGSGRGRTAGGGLCTVSGRWRRARPLPRGPRRRARPLPRDPRRRARPLPRGGSVGGRRGHGPSRCPGQTPEGSPRLHFRPCRGWSVGGRLVLPPVTNTRGTRWHARSRSQSSTGTSPWRGAPGRGPGLGESRDRPLPSSASPRPALGLVEDPGLHARVRVCVG